jgi:hypothetical protein
VPIQLSGKQAQRRCPKPVGQMGGGHRDLSLVEALDQTPKQVRGVAKAMHQHDGPGITQTVQWR